MSSKIDDRFSQLEAWREANRKLAEMERYYRRLFLVAVVFSAACFFLALSVL